MTISPTATTQQAQAQASVQSVVLKKSFEAEEKFAETIKETSEPQVPRDPDRGQKVDVSA
ncbi:MAG: putative motility protein [Parvibaculum sp.]